MPFTPIRRGAFTLTERGLLVQGDAPYEQWVEVCALTAALAKYGFFLLGDCLNYGTATYGEKYREAEEFTGLTRKRLRQIAWVANKVDVSRRRDTLEFGMHQEVAALEPAGQAEALDWIEAQARSGKEPSRTDVRRYVQDLRRAPVVRNIGEIQGKFHVVSADPPWPYHDSGASAPGTSFQKAENHYATMSIEKIAAIPVKDHVLKNAVLFLWVTSPMLSACWPVIEAWGFEYKTGLVWDKVDHIVGHYVSVRHEHLLLCTRGSCTPAPQDLTPMIDSVPDDQARTPPALRETRRVQPDHRPALPTRAKARDVRSTSGRRLDGLGKSDRGVGREQTCPPPQRSSWQPDVTEPIAKEGTLKNTGGGRRHRDC